MSVYTREISRLGRLGDSHHMVLDLVRPGSVVLDVGCASGYLARELLARGARAVDGLEYDPEDAEAARTECRRVIVGSVEDPVVVAEAADGAYDAIVLADVLEHLRYPEAALRSLVPKLKPGGRVVISVPNIAHFTVRAALVRGRFRYQDIGLLDRTHLRFFTRESLAELVESVGLRLDIEEFTFCYLPPAELIETLPVIGAPLARAYEAVTRRGSGLLAYQFVIAAAAR